MADENSSDSEYDEKVSKKVKKIIERSHKEALLVQKMNITSEQKKCESCDVYFGTSYHFDEHIRKKTF